MCRWFNIFCFFLTVSAYSQTWTQVSKVVASDRAFVSTNSNGTNLQQGYLEYGYSISIDGDFAMIGSWREDEGTFDPNEFEKHSGAVYFIEKGTNGLWIEKQKIVAADGAQLAFFGYSVSISGDYLIIGAPGRRFNSDSPTAPAFGAAYIFERNSSTGLWEEKQKLHAVNQQPVPGESVSFSTNVEIKGIYAVVGDVFFKRDPDGIWREKSTLSHPECTKSIFGDIMVIGCELDHTDENGNNTLNFAGAAYIMELENDIWVEKQKIVALDRQEGDLFGGDVSMNNDYLVIGARNHNLNENGITAYDNSGAAYIFKKGANNLWSQEQKVVASDRYHSDQFGNSVSIDGDLIVIGSRNEDPDDINSAGSAYVFKKDIADVWNEVVKLKASDKEANDRFGYRVAISNDDVIISAPYEDHDEIGNNYVPNTGSVYVFSSSTVLSTDEYSNTESVLVYPNPSFDKVFIKLNEGFQKGTFLIRDLLGKQVIRKEVFNESLSEVEISSLKKGVYLLTVISDNNKIKHFKFIKK